MYVKFLGDTNSIYNTEGLTSGDVYRVVDVHPNDKHVLLIVNDYDENKYYHKSLFSEIYQDDNGVASILPQDKLSKLDCCDIIKLQQLMSLIEIIVDDTNINHIKKIYSLINSYKDAGLLILRNCTSTKKFTYKVRIENKEALSAYVGEEYKFGIDDRKIRYIHTTDEYLIGRIIYINRE